MSTIIIVTNGKNCSIRCLFLHCYSINWLVVIDPKLIESNDLLSQWKLLLFLASEFGGFEMFECPWVHKVDKVQRAVDANCWTHSVQGISLRLSSTAYRDLSLHFCDGEKKKKPSTWLDLIPLPVTFRLACHASNHSALTSTQLNNDR